MDQQADRTSAELTAEELARSVTGLLPAGVVHVGEDGRLLYANPEALRFLGLTFDEIARKYIHNFDVQTIREDGSHCPFTEYPVMKALATGEPQLRVTIGLRQPDGEVRWAIFSAAPVRKQGAVVGAVVTFLDVTAQKRAEAARAQAEALLRAILESSSTIILATTPEGTITYINGSYNVPLEDVFGRPAWDFVVPADREMVKAIVKRVRETAQSESYETAVPTGEHYSVTVAPTLLRGEVAGLTFVAHDVCRQKELETRVLVADRMASIGTLAAGVAHEINNPLTYTLANLQILGKGLAGEGVPPRDALGHVEAALEGASRIRDVVRDLNSFTHVDGRCVPVDVRQLLDASARMAEGEIRYRARIVRDYGEVPPLVVDESRLGQVFLNLIVNAAQAIPEGDASRHEIRLVTRTSGDRIVIEVADMGAGIPADLLHKVFDPFVTTKPKGVGTGLGLYICRNIVDSIGGELSVTSTVGQGSTFRVTIPLASALGNITRSARSDPPVSAQSAAILGPASRQVPRFAEDIEASSVTRMRAAAALRRRMLIIDDEPHILDVLETLLADYDVTKARSGREACELIAAHEFDAMICDLIMPDTTGMDVFDFVQSRRPGHEARIVFMTGCAFTERARQFIAAIANPVLDKPFRLDQVRRALEHRPEPAESVNVNASV